MIKNTSPLFDEAVKRICQVTECSPSDLPDVLEISGQAISNAKKKARIPKTWAKKIQEKYGVNAEWILNGEGEIYMSEFHQQLANELYTAREMLSKALKKVYRYGATSEEAKLIHRMQSPIPRLHHLLDEHAFKECTDIPEESRLRLYYQTGKRIQVVPVPPKTNTTPMQSKLGQELADIKALLQESGADDEEIRRAIHKRLEQQSGEIPTSTGTDTPNSG